MTSPSHASGYTAEDAPSGAQSASAKHVWRDLPRNQLVHGIPIGGTHTPASVSRVRPLGHVMSAAGLAMQTRSRMPCTSRVMQSPVNPPGTAHSASEVHAAHSAGPAVTQVPLAMSQIGARPEQCPGMPAAAPAVASLHWTQVPVSGWQTSVPVHTTSSQMSVGPASRIPASPSVERMQAPLGAHVSRGPHSSSSLHDA
jgi:hypothetical protein